MIPSQKKYLLYIVIVALIVRLIPAYLIFGSFDMHVWYFFSGKIMDGSNPYTENMDSVTIGPITGPIDAPYPPPWFYLLGGIRLFSEWSNVPFYFLIKIPSILADVLIAVMIFIASERLGLKKKTGAALSFFYAINPISIFATAVHGQFDTIPILFVLLAWYSFKFWKKPIITSSLFLGLGIMMKNFPVILLPVFLWKIKTWRKRITYTVLSGIPILLSLLPFFLISKESFFGVIDNLLTYRGGYGYWGYPLFIVVFKYMHLYTPINMFENIVNSNLFDSLYNASVFFGKFLTLSMIILVAFFIIKKMDSLNSIIAIFLTFYFFTSGLGPTYLVWIVPFAILSRDKNLAYYTIFASLYILINELRTEALLGHFGIAGLFGLSLDVNLLKMAQVGAAFIIWPFCGYWLYALIKREQNKYTRRSRTRA